MKKVFVFIVSAILVLSICFSSVAADVEQYTYDYGSVSVIFDADTPFSEESREHIANVLVDGEPEIETYGLACLFGHKYVTDTVVTITHCVSATQPRCLQEIFEVSECSRCGKTKTELFDQSYIFCCP